MSALTSGILLKLINGMDSGAKSTSGHRSSLLQVTDILPVDLDEKRLFPKHGFYIKISDCSHSIYASLPSDQEDFVLSNKVQLGQFIYVDRLEPGSPVPVIKGAKPIPGRHPLVKTTEPLVGLTEKEKMKEPRPVSRRSSWATGPEGGYDLKPMVLEKDRLGSTKKPLVRTRSGGEIRASLGGGFSGKMADGKGESPSRLRKSSATVKFLKSKNGYGEEEFLGLDLAVEEGELTNLPGNLSTLSKEAIQWQETSRRMALRALKEATTMETLVSSLGMFSRLIETARVDTPMVCFDRFLEFHHYIVHAMTDMAHAKQPELGRKILKSATNMKLFRERTTLKSSLDPIEENDENMESHLNNTIELGKKIEAEASKWFIDFLEISLESAFKKPKGMEDGEAKMNVLRPLILKVINWIEVKYFDSATNKKHQRAQLISRKLRMKMK